MGVSVSRLDNGLRIVTESIGSLDTVALGVWVKVGSRHESLEDQGISHFLEHMAFKGTQRRSARGIAEEIESVGGCLNAATGAESTCYHVSVLREDVGLAVDILGDILRESVFDVRELDLERGVILQEISASHDAPEGFVFDLFMQTAYPDQSLGRSILGTGSTVRSFTPKRLRIHLDKHYSGSEMILFAAGAVSHEMIHALASEHMGQLPTSRSHALPDAAQYRGGTGLHERDLEQVQLVLGFEGPCLYDENLYAGRLLAMMMGGGMSSRLFQQVREARGLCYHISSFCSSYADTGIFGIHAATAPEDVRDLLSVVMDELHRAGDGITQSELERGFRQVKADLIMGLETSSARAERIGKHVALFDHVISVDEVVERFAAVTIERIQDVLIQICSKSRPTLAAVGRLAALGDDDDDLLAVRMRGNA